MGLRTESPDEPVDRLPIWENPDYLLPAPDFLNEPFDHVCRPKPAPIFAWQGQHRSYLKEAVFEHFKGRRSILRKLFSEIVEAVLRLLLGGRSEELIQDLVHPILVRDRRLVEDVTLEVGLTPLPDQAWERLLQRLLEAGVRIARRHLNSGKTALLELLYEPVPSLLSLAEGYLKP